MPADTYEHSQARPAQGTLHAETERGAWVAPSVKQRHSNPAPGFKVHLETHASPASD